MGTLGGDPPFGDFGDHGGQTKTLSLQAGSPAIDAGIANPQLTRCDQRGGNYSATGGMTDVYERQVGPAVDIGAYERGAGDRLFKDGFDEDMPQPFECYPS